MRKCQQAEKQRNCARLADPQLDHAGIRVKQSYELRREYVTTYADSLRQHHGRKNTEARPLLRPVILFCPQVLADKGSTGHIKACDGQERKTFNLRMGAVSRHCQLSEGIDLGLDDDIGKGDDGILHPRRKSVMDDFLQHITVKPYFSPLYSEYISFSHQVPQAQDHAGRLGNHRSHCR